jgi:alkylation response protein AidB-like acyl-CoA dehydrogenase
MNPSQPAHEQYREALQRILPSWRAGHGDLSFQSRRAWQALLAEEGWVGMGWPASAGGRGLAIHERFLCEEVAVELDAPRIAGVLGVSNVAPTIQAVGDTQHRAHLPAIQSGEEIWCQGFSEPDAGSDLASLRTKAAFDGSTFVINGQKLWTTDGLEATHCQLLVRTDPTSERHAGLSCLMIPLDLPGVERRPIKQITGDSGFAEIFFDDVVVPAEALMGALHDGWRVVMTTLAHERVGVITNAAALEREALALAADAETLDAVRRDAVMATYVQGRALGALGRRSLARLSAGDRPGPEHSVIKLAWSLAHQRIAETALEVGGIDAVAGGDNARRHQFLRRRSATIAAGTTDIMKTLLAERVLGLPR